MITLITIIGLVILFYIFRQRIIKYVIPNFSFRYRTKKKPIIILILILIPIVVYFIIAIDRQLYYYGKNDWEIYGTIPFKTVPNYLGYDRGNYGFVLESEGGVAGLGIGKGAKYWTSDVEINEIIKYGYNKEKLVALVNDSLGKEYYVIFIKSPDIQSKQDLKIDVLNKDAFIDNNTLKWINIKGVSTEKMEIARNYLELFFITLIFILIYYTIRRKKDSNNSLKKNH